MEVLWNELTLGISNVESLIKVLIRLTASFLLGGIIGYEREKFGKPAGLRTHILVSLGATSFVLGCSAVGMGTDELSRVIQGIVTGIGFIGAGSILKIDKERDIKGLTTAAGVWAAAAVGVIVGLGAIGVAIITTILIIIVLVIVKNMEVRQVNVEEKDSE